MNEDTLFLEGPDEWRDWLSSNHAAKSGAWLKIAKKNSGMASITISEALDVALCYGWIDSQRKALDQNFYIQRYSPRSARSPWSQLNRERAEKLIKTGQMTPAGMKVIELARQDGRWDVAYQSQKDFEPPVELLVALKKNRAAQKHFHELEKTAQYLLVLPLLKATTVKDQTREIAKIMEKLTEAVTK
jgi:uncharacterized protein YdeI (YjbR/CyaY-like superfamily)